MLATFMHNLKRFQETLQPFSQTYSENFKPRKDIKTLFFIGILLSQEYPEHTGVFHPANISIAQDRSRTRIHPTLGMGPLHR